MTTDLACVALSQDERVGRVRAAEYPPVDVAIVAESTYPYLLGGVSAVIHDIVGANPDRSIGIIHITWDSKGDTTVRYPLPPNVAWVMPVYQSMFEHPDFLAGRARDLSMTRRQRRYLARTVIQSLERAKRGDFRGLWRLYDEGLNPRTRRYHVARLLGSREFMAVVNDDLGHLGLPITGSFWLLREFFSLTAALGGEDYPTAGVYHAHTSGYAGLVAAMAGRQHGAKVVLTEHNLYTRDTINALLERGLHLRVTANDYHDATVGTPQQRAWAAWFTEMGRMTYPACDAITYLYPDAITEAAALGSRPEISRVFPNGMCPANFDRAQARLSHRHREQPVDAPDYVWKLAYAARIVPIKGMLDLLDALVLLRQRGSVHWTLDVMGPAGETPGYADVVHARCTALGLDDAVRFTGPRSIPDVIGDYDILVLPSHNEGQPMSVLEAMTAGLVVVGTDVGGMRDTVTNPIQVDGRTLGPAGLLVPPQDPVTMASALATVLEDPDTYRKMQRFSRARVLARFDLDAAMQNYRDLYAKLLDGGLRAAQQSTLTARATRAVMAPLRLPSRRQDEPSVRVPA